MGALSFSRAHVDVVIDPKSIRKPEFLGSPTCLLRSLHNKIVRLERRLQSEPRMSARTQSSKPSFTSSVLWATNRCYLRVVEPHSVGFATKVVL